MSEPDIFGINETPDGYMAVFNGQKKYIDTVHNFQLDFNTTVPAIPSGGNNRIYQQGIRHPIILSNDVVDEGPIPWALADGWIANIDTGLANQASRQPGPAATRGVSNAQRNP